MLRTSACSQRIPMDDANHHGAPDSHPEQRPDEATVEDIADGKTCPESHGGQMSTREHRARRVGAGSVCRDRGSNLKPPRLAARRRESQSNLIFQVG